MRHETDPSTTANLTSNTLYVATIIPAYAADDEAENCCEVTGGTVDIDCEFVNDLQVDWKSTDPNSKRDVCKQATSTQINLPRARFKQRSGMVMSTTRAFSLCVLRVRIVMAGSPLACQNGLVRN